MLDDNDLNQMRNVMLQTLEPLFTRIFRKLNDHDNNFSRIETEISEIKTDVGELKTDVSELKTDVSGLKTDVSGLKTDVSELKTDVSELKTDVSGLKANVSSLKQLEPIIMESHEWLATLVENKEFQKAEMDNLGLRVARMEGTLHGMAASLEPFRKAE